MIFDGAVIGILFFAAFAWGSNEPWAMAFIALAAITVLAVRIVWDCWHGAVRLVSARIFVPPLLFLALVGWQRLRPASALRADVRPPFTLEPYSTGLYALLAIAYVSLALLVANGFRSRENVRRLVFSLLALGIFEALYGLFQYLGNYNYVWDFPVSGTIARGTLIDRNHYALLLNIAICTGVGYLYYRSVRLLKGQSLSMRAIVGAPGSAQLVWLLLWLAIMGLAVVFSMSRMGIAALLGCLGLMVMFGKAAERGKRVSMILLTLFFLILGLAIYTGVDAVLARYEAMTQPGYFEKDRIPLWERTWEMVHGHTIFGLGLGTFQWAFPAFEDNEPDTPARYAHNDYLQALAEVGWVGLLLVAIAFVAAWRSALLNLMRSSDPLVRGIGLATIGTLSAVTLQEITDFCLYIPGVAVPVAVALGLNFRASALRHQSSA